MKQNKEVFSLIFFIFNNKGRASLFKSPKVDKFLKDAQKKESIFSKFM